MTTIIKRTASFVLAALFLIGCFGCSLFYTEHKITKDGFSITVDENFMNPNTSILPIITKVKGRLWEC